MADKTPIPDAAADKAPEFDGEFDVDRARRLVARLREERDEARRERDALKAASETGTADRATLEADLATARRELWTERALRKHPGLADVADLIAADTEEDTLARAERLASVAAASSAPAASEQPGAGTGEPDPLNRRPEPSLKPGHGGDDLPEFDARKVAAKVRGAK